MVSEDGEQPFAVAFILGGSLRHGREEIAIGRTGWRGVAPLTTSIVMSGR